MQSDNSNVLLMNEASLALNTPINMKMGSSLGVSSISNVHAHKTAELAVCQEEHNATDGFSEVRSTHSLHSSHSPIQSVLASVTIVWNVS